MKGTNNTSQNKLYILHPHFLKHGGASKVVLELGSRLAKKNFQVKIITTQINPAVIRDYPDLEFISFSNIPTGNLFFWLAFPFFYLKLAKILKKNKAKVIFAHSLAIYWGAAYKFFNKDTITVNYFHDLGMPYTDSDIEIAGLPIIPKIAAYIVRPFFQYLNRSIVIKANYLIANSQTSANFIEKKYNRKIDLIANPGVAADIFKPSAVKGQYIYTLGRLEKLKNIDLVIRAFAGYCKKNADNQLKLLIIGTGIEKTNLVELAKKLNLSDQVEFLGSCDQKKVATIASQAKVGIFLCPHESFGLAAVESLICGTPVIGINKGGIAETVIDGQTGLLTNLEINDIANKLHYLLADRQRLKEFSSKSRAATIKNYSWDNSATNVAIFFKKLF